MKISWKLKLMKVVILLWLFRLFSWWQNQCKDSDKAAHDSAVIISELQPKFTTPSTSCHNPTPERTCLSPCIIHIPKTHPLKGDRNCLTHLPNLAWAMTNACAVPWNTGRNGATEVQRIFQEQKYHLSLFPSPPFILSHVFLVVPVYFVNRV